MGTHRVLVLLVEDEVKNLLGLAVVAEEGLPQQCLDLGDVGRHRGHLWRYQDVSYGSDQVLLVVVVWTRLYFPSVPLLPSFK